jgi:2-oxoglutarate ferredoxin oxidoreductase subunit alpha
MADRGISVLIAGEAGQGTDSTGRHLGEFFSEQGLHVFVYRDYGSVIRGGHSFAVVKASDEEVLATDREIDVLIALNEDSLQHLKDLKKDGLIICSKGCKNVKGKTISVPFDEIEQRWGNLFLNSACVAALLTIKGYDASEFLKHLAKRKKENAEVSEFIVNYVKKNYSKMIEAKKNKTAKKGELFLGNDAIAKGMIDSGLERYYAYPMTPATGVLHYLAGHQKEFGLALQPENEISVINMALGSAYAGKISAVGTSGGGFDLMHEALSFSGIAELPIMIIDAQRGSASTGLPTYSGQADLLSVIYAGHGEFSRIVAAPSTNEEAYELSAELLKLAWKFQIPSILLSDKQLSESYKTTKFSKVDKIKLNFSKGDARYKFTANGVSPLIIPGLAGSISKITSYEHDEKGYSIETADGAVKMQDKRAKKKDAIISEMKKIETVKIYGSGENLVFAWGSTVSAVREAMKYSRKKFKIVQPLYLEPFPSWKIIPELKKAQNVIIVEQNKNNQFAELLRKETGCLIENPILKYDGRPFEPKELAKQIDKLLG